MKFARMIQQYKYDLADWNRNGNIGDCIQNLAIENLYKELGIDCTELVKINRDDIPNYSEEKALLPMQGWFGNLYKTFPANFSPNILPVFIGFHLTNYKESRQRFLKENLQEKFSQYTPIGCRDRNTKEFFTSLGIEAYFSGCMTLTFPERKRKPKNGKIFIVDVPEEIEEIIPTKIKNVADKSITHSYTFKNYPVSLEEAYEFETKAREILERYRQEAKLIITSRIHVAMPCIATGIPVVFIHEKDSDDRFDVLNGIIPRYSLKHKNIINWTPKAPNITKIKQAIKENAYLQISQAAKKYGLNTNKLYSESEQNRIIKNLKKITDKLEQKGQLEQNFLNLFSFDWLKTEKTRELSFFLKIIANCNKKIVFWGASIYLENFIKKYKIKNKNILGIIDKNPEKTGKKIGDFTIYNPEALSKLKPDVVVITIVNSTFQRKKEIKLLLHNNIKVETI